MPSPTTFDPNTLPFNNPKESRKVAIVTGGNSGLGWYTVLHLYMHGWTVYLAARNPTKAATAVKDIKLEAEKRKTTLPSNAVFGEIIFFQLDLISLETTKQGLIRFLNMESQLDLLINNAGVMALGPDDSKDNLDIQIRTNHVNPFYLTLNLIPLLEQSKSPRVVFVSSLGHYGTDNPTDLSKLYSQIPTFISGWLRYGNSKLANIHAAKGLALNFPSILSVSLHPGVCVNTNLFSHWLNTPFVGIFLKISSDILSRFVGISNEEGAYNTLYTALSPEVTQAQNGDYFTPVGNVTEPSSAASSAAGVEHTWKWTLNKYVSKGYFTEEEVAALHEPLSKSSLSVYQDLKPVSGSTQ